MWLLAGPNGAGKTTAAREHRSTIGELVNPDELLIQYASSPSPAIEAAREAIVRTRLAISERRSFARETTLAGHSLLREVKRAKAAGFRIGLFFIGLSGPAIAIRRVIYRSQHGGHFVPEPDVRRRYRRSLANLADFVEISDRVVVFDNSSKIDRMKLVLEIANGRNVFRARPMPNWLKRLLARHPTRRKPAKR
jgi:predicted ABC-type ATPase